MKPSPHRIAKVQKMKEKALALYKEGKSVRDISEALEKEDGFKRSHTWVHTVILELSK